MGTNHEFSGMTNEFSGTNNEFSGTNELSCEMFLVPYVSTNPTINEW
jgi:hypothetical protein